MTLSNTAVDHQDGFQDLYDLIQSRTGLCLTDHQRESVPCAVQKLLKASPQANIESMLLSLSGEPTDHPLSGRLVSSLTESASPTWLKV